MSSNTFMKVDEVAETLGISKSYAYKIVQKLNAELKEKGYLTISGRVNNSTLWKRPATEQVTARKGSDVNGCLQRRKNKHMEGLLPLYRLER